MIRVDLASQHNASKRLTQLSKNNFLVNFIR